MLDRLRIRNLAIVEDAELVLGEGLNVVTGETGAGKSLVVESVGLLIGERADTTLVREGAAAASVEGEFRLPPDAAALLAPLLSSWGVELDGDMLIVRREVSATGRSRAVVNQVAVTQGSLKQLGERLVDLHGQHEHQSLLRPGAGLEVLDRLGDCLSEREQYVALRDRWREAAEHLAGLERRLGEIGERRAWMESAAREIDELAPAEGEDDELRQEASRLAHADRLRELTATAAASLAEGDGAALDRLGSAAHALEQASALDASLGDVLPVIEESRIAAADAARSLAEYTARLEADPARLEAIEARRAAIARITRKHGRDVAGLLAWRDELRSELALADDGDTTLAEARAASERAATELLAAGRRLSVKRRGAARAWGARLTRELKPLGLPHARIEFEITTSPDDFPADGLDRVQLLFSANPDESPDRLQRIASGGELSRVMLALKCALEAQDRVDLLIFDEVDSGVGGAVAQAVGERLRTLARHRQVLCVTHLPMIAALAPHHLHVTKRVASGRTTVRVERLDGRARVEELACMLAGDRVTDTTRRQARELIAAAETAAT